MGDANIEEMYKQSAEKQKANKGGGGGKPKHHYDCTRCQKDVVLPVELDRSRPIYCDDCIAIVREEKKHGKGARPSKSVAKPVPPSRDDRSASKPSVKPSVVRPAKVSEGEIVERRPREVSMSLSALKPAVKEDGTGGNRREQGVTGGNKGREEKREETKGERESAREKRPERPDRPEKARDPERGRPSNPPTLVDGDESEKKKRKRKI